ncbi:ethylmalonyl-CoA decarboxylase-like [Mytilus trossulus]|uniref:ethylmalonyl-CoA decarboxylase-like n=1 Tax=Mytilus trossulus TaxID=6551 RepID=UPI0030047D20
MACSYFQFVRSSQRLVNLTGFTRRKCTKVHKAEDTLKHMTGGSVTLDKDEKSGIAVISLDNKKKKNALSGSMMCELNDIINELQSWQTGKGLILRGENQTFCSGGDLDTFQNILSPEQGYSMSGFIGQCLTNLSQLPLISVALVEGNALGGGAEMAMSCDFMVMSDTARFAFVQKKMGVTTGFGAGTRLVRKFGTLKALDILASARTMDATECEQLGLASKILPHSENVLDLTKSWLHNYCDGDPKVVRNLKAMVVAASNLSLEDSHAIERKLFSELWGGESHLKAQKSKLKH